MRTYTQSKILIYQPYIPYMPYMIHRNVDRRDAGRRVRGKRE